MNDQKITVKALKEKVANFIEERDWHKFHSPKNLSMSIAIEASELMEKFQWIDNDESIFEINQNRSEIENELADIAIYLLSFCNATKIDLSSIIHQKLEINKLKYPVDKSKGRSTKYNKLNY